MPLATIEEAIEDIRRGRMVILMDDKDRFPLRDRIVGTLRFTGAAIYAIVGNHRCHRLDPPNACWIWYRMKTK